MNLKILMMILLTLLLFSGLAFWFLVPFGNPVEFISESENQNFSLGSEDMQFYPNLRYVSGNISYRIESCPLQKEDEMEEAFQEVSNISVLEFYPVTSGEEIYVTCEEREQEAEGNLFVAGEGGPTKIIAGDKFNVIFNGQILLLRASQCEKPNVAIHELLHALGFAHSLNKENIMFNVTDCKQTFGEDIPKLINNLYSYPSYADLELKDIYAEMRGRYLSTNFTIRNNGLNDSGDFKIKIYADNSLIKEMDSEGIKIGEGTMIMLQNVPAFKTGVSELKFSIETNFEELEKKNNEKILSVKN